VDLTESDKKTLKLFSYYVNSHGSDECNINYYYRAGAMEWNDNVFYDNYGRPIEMYEKINDLMERILNILNVVDWGTSDDNETKITINLDTKDNNLEIFGFESVKEIYYSEKTYNFSEVYDQTSFYVLIDEMIGNETNNGIVEFEGSGDSGYIDEKIYCWEAKKNNWIELPASVLDYFYSLLNDYGGWEINEGSQGRFKIDIDAEKIIFEFGQNMMNEIKLDQRVKLEF